jgi:hypothetical protein
MKFRFFCVTHQCDIKEVGYCEADTYGDAIEQAEDMARAKGIDVVMYITDTSAAVWREQLNDLLKGQP